MELALLPTEKSGYFLRYYKESVLIFSYDSKNLHHVELLKEASNALPTACNLRDSIVGYGMAYPMRSILDTRDDPDYWRILNGIPSNPKGSTDADVEGDKGETQERSQ